MTTRRKATVSTRLRRWYRRTGGTTLVLSGLLAGITAAAMYVSYWHIVFVAAHAGEGTDSARITPIMIDGLLILSSLTRAADKRKGLRPRRWATGTLISMTAITLAANGASAILRGAPIWSIFGAMVAAYTLFAGTEILTSKGKRRTVTPRTTKATTPTLVAVKEAA